MRLVVLTLVFCVTAAVQAQARRPMMKVGQLICTVAGASNREEIRSRAMRCRFQPLSGAGATFAGRIERVAGPSLSADQKVLIWSVMAPEISVSPTSLAGRYLSRPRKGKGVSAKRLGSLFRDALFPIELREHKTANGKTPGRTVIVELRLYAAKT
jgi:Protein of unknown function (DUF992)